MNPLLRHSLSSESYFQHPEGGEINDFKTIRDTVNSLEMSIYGNGDLSLSVNFVHRGETKKLTAVSSMLSYGNPDRPYVLWLPAYGLKSQKTKNLVGNSLPTDWNHRGIDLFRSVDGSYDSAYFSMTASQYAYAIAMRMIRESRLHIHPDNKTGVAGISFGANVVSVYSNHEYLPIDASVVIEGGDLVQSMLRSKYTPLADPKTVEAVEKNNNLLPIQATLTPDLADRTLAFINRQDESVRGQVHTWIGAHLEYIDGSHLMAPLTSRSRIRELARTHFERHLT